MPDIRHDLLQPSLCGSARLAAAPYTQQMALLTAFFGGPLALAALFAIDARRIGRLARDAAGIAAIVAVYLGWLAFAHTTPQGASVRALLTAELGRNGMDLVERVLALLGFGLMALLHRQAQRSATLFGMPRPNGWVAGIALIVAGNLLSLLLAVAFEGPAR